MSREVLFLISDDEDDVYSPSKNRSKHAPTTDTRLKRAPPSIEITTMSADEPDDTGEVESPAVFTDVAHDDMEDSTLDDFDRLLRMSQSPSGGSGATSPRHRSIVEGSLAAPTNGLLLAKSAPGSRRMSQTNLETSDGPRISKYRSKSVKVRSTSKSRRGTEATATTLDTEVAHSPLFRRPRSSSMPKRNQLLLTRDVGRGDSDSAELTQYVVRHFRRTAAGVVSDGDAIRSNVSSNSIASHQSSGRDSWLEDGGLAVPMCRERANSFCGHCQAAAGVESSAAAGAAGGAVAANGVAASYKIQVMGYPGVGKTTLREQLKTSDNLLGRGISVNEDNVESTVVVKLDRLEYQLNLLDTHRSESDDYNDFSILNDVDGYMILYSIDSKLSFDFARSILSDLFSDTSKEQFVILVGNKRDLEKCREVSKREAMEMAGFYDIKFAEISCLFQDNTDYLLVGTITQINNKKEQYQHEAMKPNLQYERLRTKNDNRRSFRVKGKVSQFFKKRKSFKSCENLLDDK